MTQPLPPPLHMYFDNKAHHDMADHIANLLCAEHNQSDEQYTLEGESCIDEFLTWVTTLTETNNPHVKRSHLHSS